jgi:hypothetical protein
MASEHQPGSGCFRDGFVQEVALCLRCTLEETLNRSYSPLPDLGRIWTTIAVFKSEAIKTVSYLCGKGRFVVGVVSVAGLRRPPLAGDEVNLSRIRFPLTVYLLMQSQGFQEISRLPEQDLTDTSYYGLPQHFTLHSRRVRPACSKSPPKRVAQVSKCDLGK